MKGEERVKNNDGHNSNNHTAGPQMEVAGDPLCIRSIQVKKPRKRRGKKLVCLYKRSRSSLILAQGIGHKVGPQRSIIPPAFSSTFCLPVWPGPGASFCFFRQKI